VHKLLKGTKLRRCVIWFYHTYAKSGCFSVNIQVKEHWHLKGKHALEEKSTRIDWLCYSAATWRGVKTLSPVMDKFGHLCCIKNVKNCPCEYNASQNVRVIGLPLLRGNRKKW